MGLRDTNLVKAQMEHERTFDIKKLVENKIHSINARVFLLKLPNVSPLKSTFLARCLFFI